MRYDAIDRSDVVFQHRARLRVRVGANGTLANNKAYWGFRLATSANTAVSRNATLGGGDVNGNGGNFGVDLGYLGFRPHEDVDLVLGKMRNPFVLTDGIMDPDVTPEGVAVTWTPFKGGEGDVVKNVSLTGAYYFIRELGGATADPYNASIQLRGDVGPVNLGVGMLYFGGLNAGVAGAPGTASVMPQAGNQVSDVDLVTPGVQGNFPSDDMAVIAGSAKWPFSIRSFPVVLSGAAAYNAIEDAQNFQYEVRVDLPKIWKGKAHFTFRDSGQYSTFSPWADSDFGEGTGYHSGIRAGYTVPVAGMDLSFNYFHYDRFQPMTSPLVGPRTTNRLIVDLNARF